MRIATSTLVLATLATPAVTQVSVPASVLNQIGALLPERSNAQAAYLSSVYDPNLRVEEACTADIVFIWEGAGYRNTLGYFTYIEAANGGITITGSDLLIRNMSFPPQGSLQTGDTFQLLDATGAARVFQPGERIGFFVLANGFGSASALVNSWQYGGGGVPTTSPAQNAGIALGCYTTVPSINREAIVGDGAKSQHVAMLRMPGIEGFLDGQDYTLVGFEDLNRTSNSDDDFNDAVFVVRTSPETAISTSNLFNFNPDDIDNDGVAGLQDHFPEDSERAYQNRYPASGEYVIGFEDNYPEIGDADYNDAVIAFHYVVVTDAGGQTKDIVGDYHLIARGAAYDHAIGLHLPGLPATATGIVRLEHFLSDAALSRSVQTRPVSDVIAAGNRIPDLFESTTAALPPPPGFTFTNTYYLSPPVDAASTRLHIEFATAIDGSALGAPPYDPYLSVKRWDPIGWDVHLAGKPGFTDRPTHLPDEAVGNPTTFIDANGYPFALLLPTAWRHPLEFRHIENAYPGFGDWRTSGGSSNPSWYLQSTGQGNDVAEPLTARVPVREWVVTGPTQ